MTIITDRANALGPRGFLSNWPEDVVMVINGMGITRADILKNKRQRQRRLLQEKMHNYDPVVKPCFVWTFHNKSWLYGGWWLYVKTLKLDWQIDERHQPELVLKAMSLFPCGLLPVIENFDPWMAAFAEQYHRPTWKRPENQGMAMAWATINSSRSLVDINRIKR